MHTDKNIHWNLTSCIIWWQSMGQTVKATCAASVCCSSFTLCWLNMKKQQSNNSSLTEAKWDLFTLSAVVWAWCRFSECEALNHNELKKWWWRSNSLAWNKIFISAGSAERMTDRPIHWQSNIVCPLWLSLILLSLSSEVSSADRCQEENSLARKKKTVFNQVCAVTQTGRGWAVYLSRFAHLGTVGCIMTLWHQCLLMCGPIRELLDVVWAKQITVVICMEGVQAIITRTWGAQNTMKTQRDKHTQVCDY